MSEFLKILLSLSLSGSLLTITLILLKKLYQDKFSKCWQYYIWLTAAFRFLLPFAPDHTLVGFLFQTAETAVEASAPGSPFDTQEAPLSARKSEHAESSVSSSLSTADSPAFGRFFGKADNSDRFFGIADNPDSSSLFSTKKNPASGSLSGTTAPPASDSPSGSAVQTALPGLLTKYSHGISILLFFIWFLPATGLFIRNIMAYRNFLNYIKTSGTAVSDIHILNLLAACEEACGIQKPVELYCLAKAASPVMTGFFHPCIAIARRQISDTALKFIFTHELTHYKRRDMFYKWLIQAVVCMHWFNPLVYLLEREVCKACELSCDEAVIRSLSREEKIAYGNTLLLCSKSIPASGFPASSLTLTEGAKQLKERLGAIMNERKQTKTKTAAAAILTAGICISSAITGAYAAPLKPSSLSRQDLENTAPGKTTTDTVPEQTLPDRHLTAENISGHVSADNSLPDKILSRYRSLLALKTDAYQDMSVSSFRENAVFELDTPEGMKLLSKAAREESLRFSRFTDENAFFLCNTLLPLTNGEWKTYHLTSAAAERSLQNGQIAELEFNADITILNPDIKISEYEQAYSGLYQAAQKFLSSRTDAVLADSLASSVQKVQKQAEKTLKKYAAAVSRTGNIQMSIRRCMYGPEDPAAYDTAAVSSITDDKNPGDTLTAAKTPAPSPAEQTASKKSVSAKTSSGDIPAYIKKILTLKADGYQNFRLEDFLDYTASRYEDDHSLWKAKNRLAQEDRSRLKELLSSEDYHFLTVTLPCTESESTYPSDRVGNIPPDFGSCFDLPYPRYGTSVHFEWCVRYEPSDPDLTVGQRDEIIINILHGMDAFVADTPEDTNIGSTAYLKKMRRCLKELITKNSGRGLNMTLFQCHSG